mgnify:FL=1
MIKETVDAVRLAELEGDKVISTAKVNGQDMKNQIKIQGAEYRTEKLKEAKEKAEKEKNHLTYRRRRSQESSLQTEPSWKEMQSSWQPADSLIRVPVPQVTDTASQENWD